MKNDGSILLGILRLMPMLLLVGVFVFMIWVADGAEEVEEDMKRDAYIQDHPEEYVKQYFKDHPDQPFDEAKHYLDSIEEDKYLQLQHYFDTLGTARRSTIEKN